MKDSNNAAIFKNHKLEVSTIKYSNLKSINLIVRIPAEESHQIPIDCSNDASLIASEMGVYLVA